MAELSPAGAKTSMFCAMRDAVEDFGIEIRFEA